MKNHFDTNPFAAAADRSTNFQMALEIIDKNVNIYGYQNRHFLTKEDLEDACQVIRFKVWKHLSSFNPAKASLQTWVSRIVENGLKDAFKAKMRHNSLFRDPFSRNEEDDEYTCPSYGSYRGDEFEADRGICIKENMSYIRQSFDSLPEPYRKILDLDKEGYTTAEIADILCCDRNKVYLLRHRAQKAYAKRLDPDFLREYGISA